MASVTTARRLVVKIGSALLVERRRARLRATGSRASPSTWRALGRAARR